MSKMFGGLAAFDTVSTAATAIAAESDLLLLRMAHMLLLCSAAPAIDLIDIRVVRAGTSRGRLHVHSDSLPNTKHSTWALPLIQYD